MALAQQALTVQAATANRLSLGIGPSHRDLIEGMLGLDYSKPIRHIREYVSVLTAALSGEQIDFEGEEYKVHGKLTVGVGVKPPSVLIAGLGPQMLRLVGSVSDGTVIAFGGPTYLSQALPLLREAAAKSGRPQPRVLALFPVAITDDIEAGTATIQRVFARYNTLPSYRRNLDVEGTSDATGGAILGTETEAEAKVKQLAELGVTDLLVAPLDIDGVLGARDRTYEFLVGLARKATQEDS